MTARILGGFALGAMVSSLWAVPPRVQSSQPKDGEQQVPVTLAEFVVTFDQDMDMGGFSFMGGGETFPEMTGKPVWRTPRECALPVRLGPARSYVIGINRVTGGNFKSLGGEAADSAVICFSTAGSAPAPEAGRDESVLQLREAIEQRYSYRDVHQVDWPRQWESFAPKLLAASSPREFAKLAGEMLAATRDPHIWLMEGGEIVPAFRREAVPNVNPKLLPALIQGFKSPHPMVWSGMAAKGVGYLAIHSWEKKHGPPLLEAALAAYRDLRGQPGLILDVRLNGGGDETMARQFASQFIPAEATYAMHLSLGESSPRERRIAPAPDGEPYAGRVAVLCGPVDMSSCEAFLLMMKQVPGCKLVGARTYGASGNPQPRVLANGVTVFLPAWKALFPDGTLLEGKGIAPDIGVEAEDLAKRDPVLEKAIALLSKP